MADRGKGHQGRLASPLNRDPTISYDFGSRVFWVLLRIFRIPAYTEGVALHPAGAVSRRCGLAVLAAIQFREKLTESWSAEEDQLGFGAESQLVRIAEGLLH